MSWGTSVEAASKVRVGLMVGPEVVMTRGIEVGSRGSGKIFAWPFWSAGWNKCSSGVTTRSSVFDFKMNVCEACLFGARMISVTAGDTLRDAPWAWALVTPWHSTKVTQIKYETIFFINLIGRGSYIYNLGSVLTFGLSGRGWDLVGNGGGTIFAGGGSRHDGLWGIAEW